MTLDVRTANESLWRRDALTLPFAPPPLVGEARADVAVVGGGFTGLSAALHLAELGRSVTLIEAEDIGFGASGRNGGQVNPGLKHGLGPLQARFGAEPGAASWRMGQEAPDFLAGLVQRLGLNCGLEEHGLIRLAHNRGALGALWSAAEDLERQGIAVRRLPDQAAVEAATGTRRYLAGYLDPRGRAIRPQDMAWELARAAERAGVRIHAKTPAQKLEAVAAGWRVRTPRGEVLAREVIVATNGYTDGLIPGLAQTLLPVNSFQIATEPLPAAVAATILPGRQTVYDSRRLVLYFRKTSDDRLVLGGRASFNSARGEGGQVLDYSVMARVLVDIFPQLKGAAIAHRWTGLVCITRDYLPHYHRPQPGLHVVLGFNGRGVALANRAGAWIARALTGTPDSVAIPPSPITPIPFHRWRAPILNLGMRGHQLLDFFGR